MTCRTNVKYVLLPFCIAYILFMYLTEFCTVLFSRHVWRKLYIYLRVPLYKSIIRSVYWRDFFSCPWNYRIQFNSHQINWQFCVYCLNTSPKLVIWMCHIYPEKDFRLNSSDMVKVWRIVRPRVERLGSIEMNKVGRASPEVLSKMKG